jgi:MFS family permease
MNEKRNSESMIRIWAALATVSLGIFAITLDGSMMPVAIGSIVNGLNTQVGFVQAAMALHSLVMASMYLSAGKLADRFGEKRIFVTGAMIFAGGTLVAALSPSVWILLLGWSLVKPIGGAMMIPAASSIIVLNYEGSQRSTSFGIFSAFVAAAAVIGPIWMGLLAGALSWRWAFGSEPLIIALLLFFASMVVEKPRTEETQFDAVGAVMTFVGLGLIVLGATLAGEFGWWHARRPFYVGKQVFAPFGLSGALLFMAAGVVVLFLFVIWSARRIQHGKETLFQIALFRNRMFASGVSIGFLFQLTVGGLLFVLPVFLQSALQINALDTALVLLPYTLGIFIFALGASRLPQRLPANRIVQAGLFLMLIGGGWVYHTASLELAWASLIPALFCFGAGAGVVLARLGETTLSTVQPNELGEATGGDSTGKELGVAFGVSVLGSIFLILVYGNVVDRYDAYHDLPKASVENREKAIIELEDWAAKLSQEQWQAHLDSLPKEISKAYESIVNYAYLSSYRKTLRILIGAIVVMLLVSFLLKSREKTEIGKRPG